MTTRSFEETVQRRSAFTVGPQLAACGGFRDVMELQQYASGQQHLASPDQVKQMALFFGIPLPPGYGAAPRAARARKSAAGLLISRSTRLRRSRSGKGSQSPSRP
jgi:hypothetical protein